MALLVLTACAVFIITQRSDTGIQTFSLALRNVVFIGYVFFVVSLALNPNIGHDPNIFGETQWYSSFFVLPFVTSYECIVYKFTQRLGITIKKIRALRAQWCHFIVWVALVMLTVLLEYSRLQWRPQDFVLGGGGL